MEEASSPISLWSFTGILFRIFLGWLMEEVSSPIPLWSFTGTLFKVFPGWDNRSSSGSNVLHILLQNG